MLAVRGTDRVASKVKEEIVISAGDLAARLDAELRGPADLKITGVNSLAQAVAGDVTFIGTDRYAPQWIESNASAALVTHGVVLPREHAKNGRAILYVANADLALAETLALFDTSDEMRPPAGIAPAAVVDSSAEIHETASVGACAFIGPRASIGPRSIIQANVFIGADCVIGADCRIRAGVVIRERCTLGDRVSIHSNAVIGSDGFGYRPDGRGGMVKLPHIGIVEIHDDVEIGACATIDRAKYGATVIEAHVKLDNLVQIGHNVRIGRGSVLASQAGVAGSAVVGEFCQLGGKSAIADHVRIGNRVRMAGYSATMRDLPDGATVGGVPAVPIKSYWRVQSALHKLPSLLKLLARQGVRPSSIAPRDESW